MITTFGTIVVEDLLQLTMRNKYESLLSLCTHGTYLIAFVYAQCPVKVVLDITKKGNALAFTKLAPIACHGCNKRGRECVD